MITYYSSIKESLKKRYLHLSTINPRSHLPVCTEQCGWQLSAVVMRDGLLVCRITGLKKIHKGEWEKKIRIWSKYFEFISTMTSDWNSLFVLNQLCIKAYRESRNIEVSSDKLSFSMFTDLFRRNMNILKFLIWYSSDF